MGAHWQFTVWTACSAEYVSDAAQRSAIVLRDWDEKEEWRNVEVVSKAGIIWQKCRVYSYGPEKRLVLIVWHVKRTSPAETLRKQVFKRWGRWSRTSSRSHYDTCTTCQHIVFRVIWWTVEPRITSFKNKARASYTESEGNARTCIPSHTTHSYLHWITLCPTVCYYKASYSSIIVSERSLPLCPLWDKHIWLY